VHKERHLANQLCLLLLAQGDYLDVVPIDVGQFGRFLCFGSTFNSRISSATLSSTGFQLFSNIFSPSYFLLLSLTWPWGLGYAEVFFSVNSLRSQNRLLVLRIKCIVSRCSTLWLLIQLQVRIVRYERFSRSEVSTSSYNRLQALQIEIQSTPSLPRCPRELQFINLPFFFLMFPSFAVHSRFQPFGCSTKQENSSPAAFKWSASRDLQFPYEAIPFQHLRMIFCIFSQNFHFTLVSNWGGWKPWFSDYRRLGSPLT
jgi:hypothetical protein